MVFRGRGKGGIESYRLMHREFMFGKIKNVLEVDGGDGCITM